MVKIVIIAAVGRNGEIGADNHLLWHIPADMQFFKETTTGHKIIMGRRTFESLNGLLPNREHLVLTSQPIEGVRTFASIADLMAYLHNCDETVYVIGGAKVYEAFLPWADECILTHVNEEYPEADTYFPSGLMSSSADLIGQEPNAEPPWMRIRYKK